MTPAQLRLAFVLMMVAVVAMAVVMVWPRHDQSAPVAIQTTEAQATQAVLPPPPPAPGTSADAESRRRPETAATRDAQESGIDTGGPEKAARLYLRTVIGFSPREPATRRDERIRRLLAPELLTGRLVDTQRRPRTIVQVKQAVAIVDDGRKAQVSVTYEVTSQGKTSQATEQVYLRVFEGRWLVTYAPEGD